MFPRFYHARSVIRSFFSVSKKESKHFRSRAGKRRERDSPWDRLALMQIRRERERVLEGTPEHPIISSACSLIIASLTPTSGDPSNWFSSSPRFLQLFPLSLSVWLLTHEIAAKSLGQLFPGSIKIPMTIVRTARIYELADPRLLIVHPTVNSGVEVHRLACVYHCVCIHIHALSRYSTALGNVNINTSLLFFYYYYQPRCYYCYCCCYWQLEKRFITNCTTIRSLFF